MCIIPACVEKQASSELKLKYSDGAMTEIIEGIRPDQVSSRSTYEGIYLCVWKCRLRHAAGSLQAHQHIFYPEIS